MKQSRIFTNTELKALDQRFAGSKKDSTGVYSGRVKPKLIELLRWFERKKDIENLIQNKET